MAQQDETSTSLGCFKWSQQFGRNEDCQENLLLQDSEADLQNIGGWTENEAQFHQGNVVADNNSSLEPNREQEHTPKEIESQQQFSGEECYNPMEVYLKKSVEEEP